MSVAFPPCPECDGRGYWTEEFQPGATEFHKCPSCGGRGVLITDELVEAGAQALYAVLGEVRARPLLPSDSTIYHMAARAVLVAVVEKLKENQQ